MDYFHKVETIEGKGLGCIALNQIKTGTLILQGHPSETYIFQIH